MVCSVRLLLFAAFYIFVLISLFANGGYGILIAVLALAFGMLISFKNINCNFQYYINDFIWYFFVHSFAAAFFVYGFLAVASYHKALKNEMYAGEVYYPKA